MSYFLPSFFQKRILRYALSRLELIETNELDLGKLDITWGKRSTVELREVGICLKVRVQYTEWILERMEEREGIPRRYVERLIRRAFRNYRLFYNFLRT